MSGSKSNISDKVWIQSDLSMFFTNVPGATVLGFWSEQASESVYYDWYKLWVDNKYKRELDHKDYNKQLLKCGVTYNSRHLK